MKRIDVVTKYFHPVIAGIETNILNVYSVLAEHGFTVVIHTSNDMPLEPGTLPEKDEIRGLPIRRYPWHWYGIVPDIDWAKTDAVALHNFNVFPHLWMMLLVFFRRLSGRPAPKVFLVPHGGYTPGWWTFPWYQRMLKKVYQQLVGTWLINHVVDAMRSVSGWESNETIKSGVRPELVTTIENGIEKEAFTDVERLASEDIRKTVTSLGTYVVQVGRIHPIKNQATAIRALAMIDPSVKFAVAGPVTDQKYKRGLDRLITDLKLTDRVVFLGVVEGIDKYYLLKHSLANVHMASWESYCNAMHESMSQGAVAVVARGTATEELIRDNVNGYVVGVDDSHAVAERVNRILREQDSPELQAMRERNRAFALDHAWEKIAERVEVLYRSVWE